MAITKMKNLIKLSILFFFIGCVPATFERNCTTKNDLIGTYKIDEPFQFYKMVSKKLNKSNPSFNLVKIEKHKKKHKYIFSLYKDKELVESQIIKLNKNEKGAYSHSKNHHFFTIIIFTNLGGRKRYFGINAKNNLITEHQYSGIGFLLFIPIGGNGFFNFVNEWQRID